MSQSLLWRTMHVTCHRMEHSRSLDDMSCGPAMVVLFSLSCTSVWSSVNRQQGVITLSLYVNNQNWSLSHCFMCECVLAGLCGWPLGSDMQQTCPMQGLTVRQRKTMLLQRGNSECVERGRATEMLCNSCACTLPFICRQSCSGLCH